MERDITYVFGFLAVASIAVAFIGVSIYLMVENRAERRFFQRKIADARSDAFKLKTFKRLLYSIQVVEDCFPRSLPPENCIDDFRKYDSGRWKVQAEIDSIKEEVWEIFDLWRYKSKEEVAEDALGVLENVRETLHHHRDLVALWKNKVSEITQNVSNSDVGKAAEDYILHLMKNIKPEL